MRSTQQSKHTKTLAYAVQSIESKKRVRIIGTAPLKSLARAGRVYRSDAHRDLRMYTQMDGKRQEVEVETSRGNADDDTKSKVVHEVFACL